MEILKCKECGGRPCICHDDPYGWAAHCMDCENQIGHRGFYDPCAESEEAAIKQWNELNEK